MEIRVNLILATVLAAAWAGVTASEPAAALDPNADDTRQLTDLEDRFARDRTNPRLARELMRTYLEIDRPLHAITALQSADPALRERPRVAHRLAQAYEAAGRIEDALATAERARDRCGRALGFADGPAGASVPSFECTTHTYASLRVHHRALEQMARWGVTEPRRDHRARLAYDVAMRSARIASAN